MQPLVAFNLSQWVEANRHAFEPPVGNKVIWEDSQFTAMIIRGPNARRDFHVDPSDEIFYMLCRKFHPDSGICAERSRLSGRVFQRSARTAG